MLGEYTYFGICNENFKVGHPGNKTPDAWSWNAKGNRAFHGSQSSNNYEKHTLGETTGKEVSIDYDGRTK